MIVLHIAEPFWSAWKFYGWDKPIAGIGINVNVVKAAEESGRKLLVTIGKDPQKYQISPVTVRSLGEKYNSIREVRNGTKVIVVPQSELTKYEDNT